MNTMIKYVPIYKGEYNTTPDRYEEIQSAKRYIRVCKRRREKKAQSIVEWSIILTAAGYLVLAILR